MNTEAKNQSEIAPKPHATLVDAFRTRMQRGWPEIMFERKGIYTGRQVTGLMAASKLRNALSLGLSARLTIQQAFVAENIDADVLEDDNNLRAEVNRFHRYGPMSPLEAAQFFHYLYRFLTTDADLNPKLAKGCQLLQPVALDFAAEQQVSMDAIWKARQLADLVDLHYPDFVTAVIKGHMASGDSTKPLRLRDFSSRKAKRYATAWIKSQAV